jgi:class 3 adenylate cyclase/Tfp pilus assembly protein PilF
VILSHNLKSYARLALLGLLVSIFLSSTAQEEMDTTFYKRADSLINKGKYGQSIEMYQLFINSGTPERPADWGKVSDSWNNIGVCYYVLQDFDKAALSLEKALAIDREMEFDTYSERLSNLGMVYKKQGYYNRAITYYEEALKLAEENENKRNIAIFLNNIGSIYDEWGRYDKAIEYFERSLRIKQEIDDEEGIANSLNNIGMVYYVWKKYDDAIQNFKEALALDVKRNDKKQMAMRINNIGISFFEMKNFDSAEFYYRKALGINIESGSKDQVAAQYNNLGMLYLERKDHEQAGKFLKLALDIYEDLNLRADIVQVLSNLGFNESQKKNYQEALDYLYRSVEVATELQLKNTLIRNYLRLSEIYDSLKSYEMALNYYKTASQIKDSLFTEESHLQIADFEVKYETERKQKEIEISNLKLKRQKTLRNSLFGIISLILVLAGLIYYTLRLRIRDNRIIQGEKAKSDRLLLNILPEKVANDLKNSGDTKPESFDNVTVLFTDLCNFTELSSGLKPEFIISELNQMFTTFDSIIEKHGCERIKTIGDAYMAVCGLPVPDPDHASNIVGAALEMLGYMEERRKLSPVKWQIRIGIDSGSVVAGVVGVKKYIYDVFGDTVNTASRMESCSDPMMITVSENTYKLVKDKFDFTERDSLVIKGKGTMKIYTFSK